MAEVYKLSDHHRPSLPPGPYQLNVAWKIEIDGHAGNIEATESVKFQVASERFWLNPSEIDSVYPPEGSIGDYAKDFPHIALSRDTLPWEHSAMVGTDAPWLALLLISQDEAAQCPLKTISLKTYKETLAAYSPQVVVDLEPGQENEPVTVIELPRDVPNGVLPQVVHLKLLCHARVTESEGKPANSVAVVVSNRLPSPGRNTLHLVALENRFTNPNFPVSGGTSGCLLISLKSWSFTSQAASNDAQATKSIDAAFSQLETGWLQLTPAKREPTSYESAGFVPLPHRFRSGESGASWYAGPLTCGVPVFRNQDAPELVKLPAQSADDLLWFDEELGMLNVTYAAAWELGRLLAVQNRSIFSLLSQWRRQQIHCHRIAKEGESESACCHLPQLQCACAEPAPKPPPALTEWLDRLRQLQGIPYRYLLPDERLLPPDSIRFVALDPNYIHALLDGVLSSVRAPSQCPERCRQGELELLAGNLPEVVTGFFLRSARVAGLPRLEVVATQTNPAKILDSFPAVRLSPSILLYLFAGKAEKIVLRQKPDLIHLSIKGQRYMTWANRGKRVLAIAEATSSAFAKAMLDQPEELWLSLTW